MREIIFILLSYLIGCISTAYYLVLFRTGRDIRETKSRNAGATNAGRIMGKSGFIITLLGDMAKGAVVILASYFFELEMWAVVLSMYAVVIGHNWPVQMGFRGGKGVATAIGVLIVVDPVLFAILGVLFGLLFLITRMYTFSGLITIVLTPIILMFLVRELYIIIGISGVTCLILFAHRDSIYDLIGNFRKIKNQKS